VGPQRSGAGRAHPENGGPSAYLKQCGICPSPRGARLPRTGPTERGSRGWQNADQRCAEEHTSELQSHSDLVCRLLLTRSLCDWSSDVCSSDRKSTRLNCTQTVTSNA